MADITTLTGAFENLLQVTVGVTAVGPEQSRGDDVLRSLPRAVVREVAEEMTTPEEGDPTDPIASEAASAMLDLDAFDRRLASGAGEDIPESAKAATVRGVDRVVTGADSVIAAFPVRKKAPIGVDGLSWSPEAPGLVAEIEACRRRSGGASLHKYTSRAFLYHYFETLKLVNLRLRSIDERTQLMTGLKELNVSSNRIECLQNLPTGLIALQAYGNSMQRVLQRDALPRCVHAGLGYNRLSTAMPVIRCMPQLMSLDLSWNSLCDLNGTLLALEALRPTLRSLDLAGNPLALCRGYRAAIEKRFAGSPSRLEQLDSLPMAQEEGSSAVGFSVAASESGRSESTSSTDGVSLTVQILGASGIPLPATVPGWAEVQEAAAAVAAAGAKKGVSKVKAKGKGAKKGGEEDEEEKEGKEAGPAEPEWTLSVRAEPCLVKDGSGPSATALQTSSAAPGPERVPAAEFLDSRQQPSLTLQGATSEPLRDALAVHGINVELWLHRRRPHEDGDEATGAGGAVESQELLGACLVPAAALLEPTDGPSAVARGHVRLRLQRLPPSTCDAVLAMQRERVRRAAEGQADEAAAATAGGKGGKKPGKGKKTAAEEAMPLTAEQEEAAGRAAAEQCQAMAAGAQAMLRVRLVLQMR